MSKLYLVTCIENDNILYEPIIVIPYPLLMNNLDTRGWACLKPGIFIINAEFDSTCLDKNNIHDKILRMIKVEERNKKINIIYGDL